MKLFAIAGTLTLACLLTLSAAAQNQQPTINQSTSTTTRTTTPPQKTMKDTGLKQRQRREQIQDRRPASESRRLRPDSLRRGGATDVDTLRR